MTKHWRYIFPNLITCGSIAVAFFSIIESIAGHFESSAWLIMLCVLLDKADGTVARLLKASSEFGVQLDSLSDLIAFGLAPAVLLVALLGSPAAGAGLVPGYRYLVYGSALLYVIAAALRLAKFNVLTEEYGKLYFFGTPTTVVGGVLVTYFLTVRKYQLPAIYIEILPFAVIVMALLMVSRIPLRKGARSESRFYNLVMVVVVGLGYICGIARIFPEYIFFSGAGYMVMGSIVATARGIRPPKQEAA